MSSIGKAYAVVGGVNTGVNLVLMGSDIGGLSVWSGFLGSVRLNDEDRV